MQLAHPTTACGNVAQKAATAVACTAPDVMLTLHRTHCNSVTTGHRPHPAPTICHDWGDCRSMRNTRAAISYQSRQPPASCKVTSPCKLPAKRCSQTMGQHTAYCITWCIVISPGRTLPQNPTSSAHSMGIQSPAGAYTKRGKRCIVHTLKTLRPVPEY